MPEIGFRRGFGMAPPEPHLDVGSSKALKLQDHHPALTAPFFVSDWQVDGEFCRRTALLEASGQASIDIVVQFLRSAMHQDSPSDDASLLFEMCEITPQLIAGRQSRQFMGFGQKFSHDGIGNVFRSGHGGDFAEIL